MERKGGRWQVTRTGFLGDNVSMVGSDGAASWHSWSAVSEHPPPVYVVRRVEGPKN